MNDKLTSCDDCGGKVSKRAATCPHCGAPLTQTVQTKATMKSSTQRKVPVGNLVTCKVCGEKRSDRNLDQKTVCQSCGDVRSSWLGFYCCWGAVIFCILVMFGVL